MNQHGCRLNSEEHKSGSVMNSINIDKNSSHTNIMNVIWTEYLTTAQYVSIYGALIAAVVIVTLSRSFFFIFLCMKASINLHNKMFRAITRATMHFFNTNASGKVYH